MVEKKSLQFLELAVDLLIELVLSLIMAVCLGRMVEEVATHSPLTIACFVGYLGEVVHWWITLDSTVEAYISSCARRHEERNWT